MFFSCTHVMWIAGVVHCRSAKSVGLIFFVPTKALSSLGISCEYHWKEASFIDLQERMGLRFCDIL